MASHTPGTPAAVTRVLSIVVALLLAPLPAAGSTGGATAPARLVPAKSGGLATASGTVQGDAHRDHVIRVEAGQTLGIDLRAGSSSCYFNVLPPGSSDAAMFIGSIGGASFSGAVPIAGDYLVRVYLMRSAARRGTAASYTINARITGKALVPLPPPEDAVVKGTAFHATAVVRCTIPYQPDAHTCQASVVRYGHDGTATVELLGPGGFVRRILLIKGVPTASDATEKPTFTRTGDTTTVRIGADEAYELPDALVVGG